MHAKKVEVKKSSLGNAESQTPVYILADTITEVVPEKFGRTLGCLDGEAFVHAVANRLADAKDETLGARLSDVRAKALVTVMATLHLQVRHLIYNPGLLALTRESPAYTTPISAPRFVHPISLSSSTLMDWPLQVFLV